MAFAMPTSSKQSVRRPGSEWTRGRIGSIAILDHEFLRMTPLELNQEIKELIVKELDLRDTDPRSIDDDEALFGEGLGLDSLDALQLAMAVEERFGVAIPEDDRAREILASVSALTAHVMRVRSGG